MPRAELEISVIVPVYEQWDSVPALLEALREQKFDDDRFEVIVVDNGSSRLPPSRELPAGVRLLICEQPGSYAARNRALMEVQGRVVAFTDADCIPSSDWLSEGMACMDSHGGDCIVAGRVRVVAAGAGVNPTAAEQYDLAMGFPQDRYVERGYGVTANLFVPVRLFQWLGPFEEARYSGGDAEFCRRAGGNGVPILYTESAVVDHPARRELSALVRKVRRVKGGQLRNGPLSRRTLYAVRSFLPPVRAWWRVACHPKIPGGRRMTVARVQARLWLAEMVETIRLLLGAKPERR